MSERAPGKVQAGRRRGIVVGILAMVAVGGLAVFSWPRGDAEALAKRAGMEFMERRFDLAEADLARVARLRSPTPLDRMLRAELAVVNGKDEEALEDLARIPDDFSMAAQARLQAGQIDLRRNRYVAAERNLREAIRLDPKRVQALRELIFIYGVQLRLPELNASFGALSELSPLTFQEVFLWCLARGVTWDANEIVETLKTCLQADPTDRWARIGMAGGLRDLRRYDEAEEALAPLPDSDGVARAARVRIALERGDDQRADSLLAAGPVDDLDLALLRGRFALARGDGPEAVRQFRIAHGKAPHLREAVLGLGQALKTTGDLDAAAPLLEEGRKHERLVSLVQKAASEKNRDDPGLLGDLGDACLDVGRLHEARCWYNLAISRDAFDLRGQQGLRRLRDLAAKSKAEAR